MWCQEVEYRINHYKFFQSWTINMHKPDTDNQTLPQNIPNGGTAEKQNIQSNIRIQLGSFLRRYILGSINTIGS